MSFRDVVSENFLALQSAEVPGSVGNGILFCLGWVFPWVRRIKGYKRVFGTYNLNEDYFKGELLSILLNTDLCILWKE